MKKISGYDKIQESGSFKKLPVGGYVVKILSAIDVPEKEYLRLSFDIAEGPNKGFFAEEYKNNTRENKKWSASATINQLVYAANGETSKGFKTFIEAVKNSNAGLTDDKIFGDFPLETNLKNKCKKICKDNCTILLS